MLKLDGREVSKKLRQKYKADISSSSIQPSLAVVLVGKDAASQVYIKNKKKACDEVGIASCVHELSADCKPEELKNYLSLLNKDFKVHAILVQFPLPKHLDEKEVVSWIDPKKDVDALGVRSVGLLFQGRPECVPCTPAGVMKILEHYSISSRGKRALVVGRSSIVGLPMFQLLQRAGATVTLCHSQTKNLREHTLTGDIVVVAAGQPQFLGRDDFKKGVVVIDVGIHRLSKTANAATEQNQQVFEKLCGDVRYNELVDHAYAATPVPGGVGPMTVTALLKNTMILAGIK